MNTQKSRSSADKTINLVIVLIIIAVLAAGAYAVYNKISDNLLEKSIADGTAPQTVETYAKQAGQSVEDFLAEYEITDSSVNGDTAISDMVSFMNVKNFAKYQGMEFADFVAEYGLTDKVAEDTLWTDAEKLIPLGIYIGGDDQVENFKQVYELDASVNAQTPWGDVAETVEAKAAELQAQMEAEAAAAANATEAPATEDAAAPAEGEATATEAPAAE